jgi:hypothetical protein
MAILESFGIGEEGDETQNKHQHQNTFHDYREETYLVKDSTSSALNGARAGFCTIRKARIPPEEEFGFSLYSYDMDSGETTKCADMITWIQVTPDPAVIYIPYYYVDDTTNLRATIN